MSSSTPLAPAIAIASWHCPKAAMLEPEELEESDMEF
jgi:hypothetical protein